MTMSKHHVHLIAFDLSLSGHQTTVRHNLATVDAGHGKDACACSDLQGVSTCKTTLHSAQSLETLTSAATGCQDINTGSENVHTFSGVVILID